MTPPSSKEDWGMVGAVAVIGFVATILKSVSKGEPLTPAQALAALLARAAFTGFVAAGIWAGVTETWILNPTFGVTVAAATAMVGTDIIEKLLVAWGQKRTGVTIPPDEKEKV